MGNSALPPSKQLDFENSQSEVFHDLRLILLYSLQIRQLKTLRVAYVLGQHSVAVSIINLLLELHIHSWMLDQKVKRCSQSCGRCITSGKPDITVRNSRATMQ